MRQLKKDLINFNNSNKKKKVSATVP
jgi:hypothetical protein